MSHIWIVSSKTISCTKEEQLDTKWYKKYKITPKSSLVVFFIRLFVVHRSLKNTLKRQQGKGTPTNAIVIQDFEDRKKHSLFATRSSNRWKNIGLGTPQATQAYNPSPPKQRVEETGSYRRTDQKKRSKSPQQRTTNCISWLTHQLQRSGENLQIWQN